MMIIIKALILILLRPLLQRQRLRQRRVIGPVSAMETIATVVQNSSRSLRVIPA